jgi:unsaturated chondroitin disaccharide hydrolase
MYPIKLKTIGMIGFLAIACAFSGVSFAQKPKFSVDSNILYCAVQAQKTLANIPANGKNLPRNIDHGKTDWRYVNYRDWCSGFWPGVLWYLYEGTGDPKWKTEADRFTRELTPITEERVSGHDLGFMMFNSFGNGYRLTKAPAYKEIILRSADSLATLYNPKVGTILSWPEMVKKMGWPHNTIIDNMINLELLFWASKNGGDRRFFNIAVKHAETTMKNHFRPDYTSYHVVVYDTVSGKKIKGVTHQGYSDSSTWARGQSWAIYGFTMCYRETKKIEFLHFAQKVADVYLKDLPADHIPYWDFNDPAIPNAPRDASAAAVTASALLDLSRFVTDKTKATNYYKQALTMLTSLSSAAYQSRQNNSAFLLHSTGHHPAGTEIDASIIYADYYYLEALLKLKKIQLKK